MPVRTLEESHAGLPRLQAVPLTLTFPSSQLSKRQLEGGGLGDVPHLTGDNTGTTAAWAPTYQEAEGTEHRQQLVPGDGWGPELPQPLGFPNGGRHTAVPLPPPYSCQPQSPALDRRRALQLLKHTPLGPRLLK